MKNGRKRWRIVSNAAIRCTVFPHFKGAAGERGQYHLSAANFEHVPVIGKTPSRMAAFAEVEAELYVWCVLPNHWHALVGTNDLKRVLAVIGRLHGCSSFEWNREDDSRGRQCWHCCADRRIRSEGHFFAVRNYIHHNPVRHG